jgi:hypothetical protein
VNITSVTVTVEFDFDDDGCIIVDEDFGQQTKAQILAVFGISQSLFALKLFLTSEFSPLNELVSGEDCMLIHDLVPCWVGLRQRKTPPVKTDGAFGFRLVSDDQPHLL